MLTNPVYTSHAPQLVKWCSEESISPEWSLESEQKAIPADHIGCAPSSQQPEITTRTIFIFGSYCIVY